MGAMLNAKLVTGGKSEWGRPIRTRPQPLKAAKNWVVENSTALKNLGEYLAPGKSALPMISSPARAPSFAMS